MLANGEAGVTQDQNRAEKHAALLRVLRAIAGFAPKALFYGAALLAMATIRGLEVPGAGLLLPAAGLLPFVTNVGVDIVASMLERVAKGELTDKRIRELVAEAIEESDIATQLTAVENQRLLARLFRRLDILQTMVEGELYEVAAEIARQSAQFEVFATELGGELLSLHEQIGTLATQQQVAEGFSHLADLILMQTAVQAGFDRRLSPLEMPRPDSAPLPPEAYASREDLVHRLCNDMTNVTWLALVDGPGKGKTQLAQAIAQASEVRHTWWISLRGHEEQTAHLHLEQQMVRWLVELTAEERWWSLYVSGWLSVRYLAALVSRFTDAQGLLIVDNLPDPLQDELLFTKLGTIAATFAISGSKILTTSQWRLPPSLRTDLGISVVSLPALSAQDILQMLGNAGAPERITRDGVVPLILGTTAGHPTLVAATVYWLRRLQWQVRSEELIALLQGDPAEEVREYERRRVLHLLDEHPKRLLYRLSLLEDEFDKELVLSIAAIPPSIDHPGECIDDLAGPWLDRMEGNQYEVTPLLRYAGRDNLSEEERKGVHRAAAEYYLAKKAINASQAHIVTSHLWQAGEYQTFAAVLTQLMLSAETPAQAKQIEWASLVLFPNTQWPAELSLDVKILMRMAQVRIRALAGGNIAELDAELEKLLAEAGPDNSQAVALAYLNTGPFLLDAIPAPISLQRAIKAVQILRSTRLIPEEVLHDVGEGLHPRFEDIIWISAARLEGSVQVGEYLQVVRQMNEEERRQLFNSALAIETTSHLVDSIWKVEADKPPEQQDWNNVLKALDRVQSIGSQIGVTSLQVLQARARAVVLADYLGQTGDALSVLDSVPDTADTDLLFLLEYTRGCILFEDERLEDAFAHLDFAANTEQDSFFYYRLDAKRRAAIIKSKREEWDDAKRRCTEVIQFIRQKSKSLICDQLEMMGELAWIHWASGNKKKACSAMYGLVAGLVAEGNVTEPRFREVFNKAGHSLGWYLPMATMGQPPPTTITGEPYTPVEAGLFGIRRERLGDYVPPSIGFSKAMLLAQLGMLAVALGLPRLAWKSHLWSSSLVEENESIFLEFSKVGFVPLAVQFGHPHEAIILGQQAARVLVVRKELCERGIDILDPDIDIQEIWMSMPDEYRRERQRTYLLYNVLGPVFSNLWGSAASADEIEEHLEAWEQAFSMCRETLEEPEFWKQAIQFLRSLSSAWAGESTFEEILSIPEKDALLDIFWHLLRSSQTRGDLLESLQTQLSVINTLIVPSGLGNHVLLGVGKFLHRHWQSIANTCGFALRSPELFREDLSQIPPDQGGMTAVRVLRRASSAIGVSLPEEILEKFRQVEATET